MGFEPTGTQNKTFKNMTPEEKEAYAKAAHDLKMYLCINRSLGNFNDRLRQRLIEAGNYGMLFYPNGKMLSVQDVKDITKNTASLTKAAADLVLVEHDPVHDTTEYRSIGVKGHEISVQAGKLSEFDLQQKAEQYAQKRMEGFLPKLNSMSPKELVNELANDIQNIKENDYKLPFVTQKLKDLGLYHDLSYTVRDGDSVKTHEKGSINIDGEVFLRGENTPATQEQFALYAAGLKQPEKPSGFFSGIREWFHKNIHPLRDFSKYDTQMKQYEIKKYDLCKDAGFDVSGKTEEIERYKAELAADAEKRVDDAAKKIQKNCGLADVDQLIGAFKKAAKADPEVGEYLIEALPKQNLSTCTDLQWDMARSGVVIGNNKKPTKDSEMHIGEDLTFMRVCKRFLPKMLQDRVDVKYAEAQEPYRKMNELMRGNTLSEAEKSELYKNWQSGEFEKAYWADKNALKVEETAEKKPNEMNADERLENGVKGRERLDQAYIEETAAKLGTDEQTVRQVFEAAKGGDDVEMNVEDLFEQPQQEQPQMNVPGQS